MSKALLNRAFLSVDKKTFLLVVVFITICLVFHKFPNKRDNLNYPAFWGCNSLVYRGVSVYRIRYSDTGDTVIGGF
jgi:hypothetical protein